MATLSLDNGPPSVVQAEAAAQAQKDAFAIAHVQTTRADLDRAAGQGG